jgi:hypothetical protein
MPPSTPGFKVGLRQVSRNPMAVRHALLRKMGSGHFCGKPMRRFYNPLPWQDWLLY